MGNLNSKKSSLEEPKPFNRNVIITGKEVVRPFKPTSTFTSTYNHIDPTPTASIIPPTRPNVSFQSVSAPSRPSYFWKTQEHMTHHPVFRPAFNMGYNNNNNHHYNHNHHQQHLPSQSISNLTSMQRDRDKTEPKTVLLPESFQLWSKTYLDHKINHRKHIDEYRTRISQNTMNSALRDLKMKTCELELGRLKIIGDAMTQVENREQSKSMFAHLSVKPKISAFQEAYNKSYPPLKKRLPELTPDKLDRIEQASKSHPPGEILVEIDGTPIHRSDITTLVDLNWLNDEIVNAYLNLIVKRSMTNGLKAYAFNTFFYPKLRDNKYNSVKRWTRKVDIFSYSFVIVPVHLGNHWCLAMIDFTQKIISYYDSLGGSSGGCCDILKDYLKNESIDKKKQEFDDENWQTIDAYYQPGGIPRQQNCSDCGIFLCTYAEYLTRQSKLDFTQQQMPYFRKKMIYEIITNRLMDI